MHLKHRFHYYNLDYQINTSSFFAGPVNPANNRTATRSVTTRPIDVTDTYATSIDLTGKFNVLGTQHQALAGFDYFWEKAESQGFAAIPRRQPIGRWLIFSIRSVTTQLNVNNLLDNTIYEISAFGGFLAQPGTPRTFMGSIRVEF